MKKKLLLNLILIPLLLCNVNGVAADNPLNFICDFGKKIMIGAGIGLGVYSIPVMIAGGVSLSTAASIASSSTAILQGAILGAATKTFTDTGLQCLLPQNYDRKHPIKNSIISTALSGICISSYNASLELAAPIIGSLTGHLTQAVIENSIEKLEEKTSVHVPWLKSGISLIGNIAGSILGSYAGRITSNALWNHKFPGANSQTDHTIILEKPTNQTEILQNKHFRLCNPAYPGYKKPFISDQSDIEVNELKNILLGNEQTPARA
ncbi:MAG: hypothetical protein HAW62_04405, partial [Endozoicomonadaceae bacterium]|nr:hypothetical protein [Endozoicomonadaceae bacterium]